MHIKLFVSAMIAALLWTGTPMAVSEPTEFRAVETVSQSATNQDTSPEEQAQAIALAHAGLTAQQVTGLRTERDLDDGVKELEVEFRYGDWEYDYTIHAGTMEILEHNKEYDPPKATQTKPVETKPAETAPPETKPAEPNNISAEEAKAIALAHAGLTADQVKGLRAEYDRDDGRPEYEVEFRSGDWEYDYTILAATGEILHNEKEYDPPEQIPTPTEPVPVETIPVETVPVEIAPAEITANQAKNIALAHAGLTAEQVKGLQAEYDRDDGTATYEVEFRSGNWEYDYEIHAETGKILDWEKDWDD